MRVTIPILSSLVGPLLVAAEVPYAKFNPYPSLVVSTEGGLIHAGNEVGNDWGTWCKWHDGIMHTYDLQIQSTQLSTVICANLRHQFLNGFASCSERVHWDCDVYNSTNLVQKNQFNITTSTPLYLTKVHFKSNSICKPKAVQDAVWESTDPKIANLTCAEH